MTAAMAATAAAKPAMTAAMAAMTAARPATTAAMAAMAAAGTAMTAAEVAGTEEELADVTGGTRGAAQGRRTRSS